MEYYSILRKKRIIIDATTRMNLEDTVINEIWHLQKDLGPHLHEVPRVIKFTDPETTMVAGSCLIGTILTG